MRKDCTSCSYNPGKKSRTVLQYSYFSVISRFPLKTVHPFRNFLAVFLCPILYKVETLDTRVQNSLWGEGSGGRGRGLDLCELEIGIGIIICSVSFVPSGHLIEIKMSVQ